MSHYRYILTIPLTEGALPGYRTLAERLLRRRSDGPIVVRDEREISRATHAMCIRAAFSDQDALAAVKDELRRFIPHVPLRVHREHRRPCGETESPCSCVLLGVQGELPCYYRQEACLRHCHLVGDYTAAACFLEEQLSA